MSTSNNMPPDVTPAPGWDDDEIDHGELERQVAALGIELDKDALDWDDDDFDPEAPEWSDEAEIKPLGELFYAEWSAHPDDDPSKLSTWRKANPALGIRILPAFLKLMQGAMSAIGFAREHLGIPEDLEAGGALDKAKWATLADVTDENGEGGSYITAALTLAVDIDPSREMAAIGAAGIRDDDLMHVEIIEAQGVRKGIAWVLPRLIALALKWDVEVVLDPGAQAGSIMAELVNAGVKVKTASMREYAQACGAFSGYVEDDPSGVRHLDQAPLNIAVAGANKRDIGDGFGWARRKSGSDISPLCAVTLAAWGATVSNAEAMRAVNNVW